MKISIVTVALSHGGAERVAVTLANGFSQRGHQVTILTDLNEPIDYIPNKEIKLVGFLKERKQGFKRWIKAIVNIRRTVKKEKPDIIIGIMGLCTLATYFACFGLKVPIVMTEHFGFERPEKSKFTYKEYIFKFWINRLYKYITVLTKADKKVIGNKLKNVTVMPNPLLLEPINEIPSKKPIVLAAGRIDAWHYKGFDVLIRAWARIVSSSNFQDSSWWLKIAGNGKQESFEYLMNFLPDGEWVYNDNVNDDDNYLNTKHTQEKNTSAEKQNSQKDGAWSSEKYNIEFLGFQKDMESLYKKSEIFVLSSRYEGFGLVLIEAMSQGCAPVACDYKGRQKEILCPEGVSSSKFQDSKFEICENGILCEPDNVNALAQALKILIENEEYRYQVHKNVVERSKYYNTEQTMIRWEKYISNIIMNK